MMFDWRDSMSERDLFRLVLSDLLSRRGSVTPLMPLWKLLRDRRKKLLLRLMQEKNLSTGGGDHG